MSGFAAPSERQLAAGDYLLGAAELGVVLLALGWAAVRVRRALLPAWAGPPALVADATLGLGLAVVVAVGLGTFGLFDSLWFPIACVAAAATASLIGDRRRAAPDEPPPAPAGPSHGVVVVAVVCAAVFAGWAIPTLTGIAGGMGRADSLWYHGPLATRFLETGNTGGLHFFDPVFFATFYPANSEVFHAIPTLAFGRDFLSPLMNLGFLALGLLSAWAIGRPYGVAPQALFGGAVILGAETMVDFQAGEALNDLVGVSLLLAAAAVLVNAAAGRRRIVPGALAVAGMAAGLAAGTKLSFLAPVVALTVAVVLIAPRGDRLRAAAWWSLPMLLAGGYWYLRNLVAVGNPIPYTKFGPLDLPMPERGLELRPGFSVSHYATDFDVWRDWFFKYLAEELGPLWPVVIAGLVFGCAYALMNGKEPLLRALAVVALITAVAYLFTPLTAGGTEGEPIAFEWNVRYLAPAIAIGLTLLPCLPSFRATGRRRAVSFWALAALALATTLTIVQWPEGGHTKGAVAMGALVLAAFAAAAFALSHGLLGPGARWLRPVVAALVIGVIGAGFVTQRHYMERRYQNLSVELHIAPAARWAQDLRDARIAMSGIRGYLNQYAFAGADLSNQVQWLGTEGEHGAYERIPDCETWRRELNEGRYEYVVTMYDPYLPGGLTDTKEGLWTRDDAAVSAVVRTGPVGVYEIEGPLDPDACGDLPDLSPSELNGDSVNAAPMANQPPPGFGTAPQPPSDSPY